MNYPRFPLGPNSEKRHRPSDIDDEPQTVGQKSDLLV